MLEILEQKYPAPKPELRSVIIAIMFGVFIGLFLWYFEPFDINLASGKDRAPELLFYGFITTIVLLDFLYIQPLLLPNLFSDKHWKVKHQMLYYLVILLVIATLNGIYTNYVNDLTFSWSNYWWIISRTFVLGGIPIAFITLIDYQRKNKLHISQARDIIISEEASTDQPMASPSDNQKIIHNVITDLKTETIRFEENAFYYAIAVGNYIDMYILNGEALNKTTYRVSLSSFEAQIDSKHLKRCHRSYLVNLNQVENISGNAQGLKLKLKNSTDIIPVSRKYIPVVRQYFQNRQ